MATRPESITPTDALPTLCGWTIEPGLNRAVRAGIELRLEPRIMQVLACLLAADGQPVTRDQLMDRVWGHEFVTEDALNRCISKLRRVLTEEFGCDASIDTIPKVGYRLQQPRGGAAPLTPTPALTALPRPPRPSPLQWPWPWLAGLGVAALAGAGLTTLYLTREHPPGVVNGEGRMRPLTTLQGNEESASLSPDGSLVAYAWRETPSDDYDLWVQPINSDARVRITDDPATDYAPVWSPDGTTLAFLRIDKLAQACAVLTVPPVGGPARRIADCNYEEWSLAWTPDGMGLVYVPPGETGLARFDLASGALTPLTFPPADALIDGGPTFSPDGQWLAFTRWRAQGVADVHVMPAAGGVPKRLTVDNLKVHGIAWENNSQHLVYSSNRAGPFALWRVSVDGDAPRRVPIFGRSADNPVIARDGKRMIYEEWQGQTNIFSVDTALPQRPPEQVTLATRWDWNPATSPDGRRLAFVSDRSGSAEIWVSDVDGRNPLKLTAFDGPYSSGPEWSPDGSQLVFDSPAVEGNFDLFLVAADGGAPRRLTTNPAEDRFAQFTPDGRAVYFTSRRTGDWEIWRMDLGSRVEQQVTRGGGYFPQLSADGQTLYFARINQSGIFRQPINDPSAVTSVIEGPLPVDCTNWRIAGDSLWYIQREAGRSMLAEHDLARGTSRNRVALPDLMYKSGISVGGDGRVYFSRVVRNETDLVLMEYAP
jgi:Tol biopolymer transport system component/DNA-binding winged helix-turn-helix (wHTH) protein